MQQFRIAVDDLAALMALLPPQPAPSGPRIGFEYANDMLSVDGDADAAQVAAILGDPQWRNHAKSSQLSAYAAAARYNKETAGITVNGVLVTTDRQSQAQLTGAVVLAQGNAQATYQWKTSTGSFVMLTAAQVIAIGNAVAAHVQECFAVEAGLHNDIMAVPPAVTEAQIDAAFAAISV